MQSGAPAIALNNELCFLTHGHLLLVRATFGSGVLEQDCKSCYI